MRIDAKVVLKRAGKQSTLILERNVYGDATFEMAGDMSTSKLTALPAATRDLAHHVVQELVEYW